MALDSAIMIIEFKNTVGEDLIKPIAMLLILLYLKKMNEEVLSSQIPGKRFSEFPNGSQTHDLPEYRLKRCNH